MTDTYLKKRGPEPAKYCFHCKHHLKAGSVTLNTDFSYESAGKHDVCRVVELLVTGRAARCEDVRSSPLCGTSGLLFEEV